MFSREDCSPNRPFAHQEVQPRRPMVTGYVGAPPTRHPLPSTEPGEGPGICELCSEHRRMDWKVVGMAFQVEELPCLLGNCTEADLLQFKIILENGR